MWIPFSTKMAWSLFSSWTERQMIVLAFWKWSWDIQKFKYTVHLHMSHFSVSQPPLCLGKMSRQLDLNAESKWSRWPNKRFLKADFQKISCLIHNKSHIWRLKIRIFWIFHSDETHLQKSFLFGLKLSFNKHQSHH